MKGELGIKVKKVEISGYGNKQELKIYDDNNDFLFIVGDNNWDKILQNAIDKKKKETIKLIDKNGDFIKEYLDIKDAYNELKLIPDGIKDSFKVLLNYGYSIPVGVNTAIFELGNAIGYFETMSLKEISKEIPF